MPHMSPISWTLILLFSLSFIMILSSMVYFSINYKKTLSQEKKALPSSEVKWVW
uniref:ATP synthase F0 subunit 8 n=1 Tax=Paralepas cf. quadrata TaxID=2977351 RepID=UPI0021CCBC7D|nr:ATP synthase F0 subunit 8 [Paralepas cf. quadrata]UWM12976.1 ATP synthase F0 subunit 8 [Paralepas cf. quadrata]